MIEYEISGGQHENQNFAKYNGFITGKYKGSLLENKLFCLGLKNVVIENGEDVAVLTKKDLQGLIKNKDSGSFYTQLKDTANRMKSFGIFVEDQANHAFVSMNVVNTVVYKNGICKIYFNRHYRELFSNLTEKYTYLNIASMIDMSNCMSLRLYEILKSQCYVSNRENKYLQRKEHQFRLNFSVDELRLMLGCVDISDPAIKKIFDRPNITDYSAVMEEIEAIASKEKDVRIQQRITPKWGEWKNFRRALEGAMKEINKKTELYVEMSYFGKGKSGKICNISFDVDIFPSLNAKNAAMGRASEQAAEEEIENKNPAEISIDDLLSLISKVSKITNNDFDLEECKTLLEVAGYSVETIEAQYRNMLKVSKVDNKMGWMICAIQRGYEVKTSTKKTDIGYQQHQYDFEALNKMIQEE